MSKLKKLLCISSVTVIVICCCCFTASAATVRGDIWEIPDSGIYYEENESGYKVPVSYPVSHKNTIDGETYINIDYFYSDKDEYTSHTWMFNYKLKEPITLSQEDYLNFNATFHMLSNVSTSYAYLRFFYLNYGGTTEDGSLFTSRLYTSPVINLYSGTHDVSVTREAEPNVTVESIQLYCQFILSDKVDFQIGPSIGFLLDSIILRYGSQQDIYNDAANDETHNLLGDILAAEQTTHAKLDELTTEVEKSNELLLDVTAEQEKTNEYLGEITADKYEAPNGNSIDNVGTVEDKIEESTQEGFSELNNIFKSFSLDTFTDGLGGIATIYNHIIPQSLWLSNLISISLGLGLFAFLLGIAIWSFGRIANRDTRVSARRDAEYIKRDGIAAHRPSRR